MAFGIPLLLAALAAPVPANAGPGDAFSPLRPQCYEDAAPAPAPIPADVPIADADAEDEEDCLSLMPPWNEVPLAAINCHDERATLWIGQMIGSCAMPRGLPPSVRQGPRRHAPVHGLLDAFLSCGPDAGRHQPVRTLDRESHDTPILATTPFHFGTDARRLQYDVRSTPLPPSADGDRLDRPPRAPA